MRQFGAHDEEPGDRPGKNDRSQDEGGGRCDCAERDPASAAAGMLRRRPLRERLDDSFSGVAIPELGDARRKRPVGHDVVDGDANARRVESDDAVGAIGHRNRAVRCFL